MKVRVANLDDLPAINALCREQLGGGASPFCPYERYFSAYRFYNARMVQLVFSKRAFESELTSKNTLFCIVESEAKQLLGYLVVKAYQQDLKDTYIYRELISNTYFHVERFYVSRRCSSCVGRSLFKKFDSWREALLKRNLSLTQVISIEPHN
ncbi:hypothetical protein ACB087_05650 [Vibrio sp. VNB-15]